MAWLLRGVLAERTAGRLSTGLSEWSTFRGPVKEHGHKEDRESSAEGMKGREKMGECLAGLGAGTHVRRAGGEE